MDAQPEPVAQLSEASRRTSIEVETLVAEVAGLRSRVGALEGRLEGAQAAQARTAERAEHLASEIGRLERVESDLTRLRDEMGRALAEHERRLLDELESARGALRQDGERLVRLVDAATARIDDIDSRLRQTASTVRKLDPNEDVARLTTRLEELAGMRGQIEEQARQAEARLEARIGAVASTLEATRATVDGWQARAEIQSEQVREARAVADAMRREVEAVNEAQHGAAEARRLFEASVERALGQAAATGAHERDMLRKARDNDLELARAADAERDARIAHVADLTGQATGRLDELEVAVSSRLDAAAEAILDLRRDLAAALRALRDATVANVEAVESGLPPEEQSAVVDQRRQAQRRSLRARRRGSGH